MTQAQKLADLSQAYTAGALGFRNILHNTTFRINQRRYQSEEVMAKGKNWIAGAIKQPGALHKELGVPQGKKIPAGKLDKAAEAGGKLGQRARLAKTLGKMRSK